MLTYNLNVFSDIDVNLCALWQIPLGISFGRLAESPALIGPAVLYRTPYIYYAMTRTNHPSLRLRDANTDPRHQLAMAHLDLIDKLMAKNSFVYACAFLEPADFYQAGYVALYNAADKYDKAENAGFRTYASKAIHNAFLSLVRDSESVVRKPRDCEDAVYFDSLDQMSQSGHEFYYHPLNPVKMQVRQLVRNTQLSDRERNILCNKYDIMLSDEPISTQELADHYHLTTQHVNRICRSAIDKLRVASVTA